MKESDIAILLRKYKNGELTEQETVQAVSNLPFEDIKFAEVDNYREIGRAHV